MAAAVLPAMMEGAQMLGNGIMAAQAGKGLYDKYKPKIKGLANNIFSGRKRKSALNYVRKLGTAKGFKKLITHDIGKAAKGVSKYVSSGKALHTLKGVTDDIGAVADVAAPLLGQEHHQRIKGALDDVNKTASHYHQIAENYNEQGKQLHDQFKEALRPKPV